MDSAKPSPDILEFDTRMLLGSWGGSTGLGAGTHGLSSQGCYVRSGPSCLNVKTHWNPQLPLCLCTPYLSELQLSQKTLRKGTLHSPLFQRKEDLELNPGCQLLPIRPWVNYLNSELWELNRILYSQSWSSAWYTAIAYLKLILFITVMVVINTNCLQNCCIWETLS